MNQLNTEEQGKLRFYEQNGLEPERFKIYPKPG